jgi:hypothetical protein
MLGWEFVPHSSLQNRSDLCSHVVTKEDVEVHLQSLQAVTEHSQLCEGDIVLLKNIVVHKCLDHGIHMPTFLLNSLAVIRQRGQKLPQSCYPNHHRTSIRTRHFGF